MSVIGRKKGGYSLKIKYKRVLSFIGSVDQRRLFAERRQAAYNLIRSLWPLKVSRINGDVLF